MDGDAIITDADIEDILNQTAHILADAFRAALASSVHFQVRVSPFVLWVVNVGVDFSYVCCSQFQMRLNFLVRTYLSRTHRQGWMTKRVHDFK